MILTWLEEMTYEDCVEWFEGRYNEASLRVLEMHGLLFGPKDLWAFRNRTIKALRKVAKQQTKTATV